MENVRLIACEPDCACHMTFGRLCEIYLEYAKSYKESWYDDERRANKHLLEKFGGRGVNEITKAEVALLHQNLSRPRSGKKKGSKYEANRVVQLLHRIYSYGHEIEVIPETILNPARKSKKNKEHARDITFTDDEMNRLIDAVFRRRYLTTQIYFLILIFCAFRKTELLKLQWKDIDFGEMQFKLRRETVKTRSTHYLPITDFVKQLLDMLPRKTKYVFPKHYGLDGHYTHLEKAWDRIREEAGVTDKILHDIRRTAATWLINDDFALPIIQKLLNHSTLKATMVYAHVQTKPVRKALGAYEGKLLATGKFKHIDAKTWERSA